MSGDVALSDVLLLPASTGVDPAARAATLSLSEPWPNPARHGLSFSFAAPAGEAELSAWDVAGRRVATLWGGRAESPVTMQWNGARDDGQRLPAGIYYVRLADRKGASVLRRVTLLH